MSLDEVEEWIRINPPNVVKKAVETVGVDFFADAETKRRLDQLKMDPEVWKVIVSQATLKTGFRQIVSGSDVECVLVDGAVYCWGKGYGRGQRSGNELRFPYTPMPWKVVLARNAHAIDVRFAHGCALLVTGEVNCWGFNDVGSVNGSKSDPIDAPVRVDLREPAIGIAVGAAHSCALTKKGSVYCWGNGNSPALGTGTLSDGPRRPAPVPLGGPASSISSGLSQTCALVATKAWCWGATTEGDTAQPKQVASSFDFTRIFAGNRSLCGLVRDPPGAVCFDRNSNEELPAYEQIRLGDDATSGQVICGISADRSVSCWQSGSRTRTKLPGIHEDVSAGYHTCTIDRDARVECRRDSLLFGGDVVTTEDSYPETQPWLQATPQTPAK